MSVDYNNFAKKFAASRKNMKWEEIQYFFSLIDRDASILDIACGSARLLEQYKIYFGMFPREYLGIDLSAELLTEAKIHFPDAIFQEGNMQEASKYVKNMCFHSIFCIAGFHHLDTLDARLKTLNDWYDILPYGGKIFMTNWDLSSPVNAQKYESCIYKQDDTPFDTREYMIPFGQHMRYYHGFTLKELEYLAIQTGYKIQENRLFDTQKNFITILEK